MHESQFEYVATEYRWFQSYVLWWEIMQKSIYFVRKSKSWIFDHTWVDFKKALLTELFHDSVRSK